MDLYAGPNFAIQDIDDGVNPVLNDTAWGAALGYRYLPKPYMALRVEARYRKWSTRNLDEWGLALALGVLF